MIVTIVLESFFQVIRRYCFLSVSRKSLEWTIVSAVTTTMYPQQNTRHLLAITVVASAIFSNTALGEYTDCSKNRPSGKDS